MMSFALDIQKFAKKCVSNSDLVVRKVVLDIGRSLVEKTPVGNPSLWEGWEKGGAAKNQGHWLVKAGFVGEGYAGGHARANWQHSTGAPIQVDLVDARDKTGQPTIDKIEASIPQKAAGLVHYITNSVPYIQALEDGHSKQAPHGMVATTEVEFQGIVDVAVSKVSK
jgi:hypothetical protein